MNKQLLVCNIGALTASQRQRHQVLFQKLAGAYREITELLNGYAFSFLHDVSLFQSIAEWITLEHFCCPFVESTLKYQSESITLELTGEDGVKEFLKAEFHLS